MRRVSRYKPIVPSLHKPAFAYPHPRPLFASCLLGRSFSIGFIPLPQSTPSRKSPIEIVDFGESLMFSSGFSDKCVVFFRVDMCNLVGSMDVAESVDVLMESKGGLKKRGGCSSNSRFAMYEAPLGYSIEDVRPNGGIEKFRSAAYSNVRPPHLLLRRSCRLDWIAWWSSFVV